MVIPGISHSAEIRSFRRLYQNRGLAAAQVIAMLVKPAKEIREAPQSGEKLGLTEDDLALPSGCCATMATQRTLNSGIPLTAGQRIDLVFQPLMRQQRRSQEQVFREAVEQAGLLPEPDQERAIGSLLVLAYHVLGESALNTMMEELLTTNLLIKVLGEHIEKGFEQGVVQARQEDFLHILHRRFSTVPDPVATQIRQVTDPERLSALLDSATDAQSLEQFAQALDR